MVDENELEEEAVGGFSPATTFYNDLKGEYYFRSAGGDYLRAAERDIVRRLRQMKMRSSIDWKSGETISEVEAALMEIQESNSIDYAGTIAGYRRGLARRGSDRLLCTRELELVKPERGEWPTLKHFFEGLFIGFDKEGRPALDQTPYFFGWLARAMGGLYNYKPNKGQALIIAGEPDCGKTLLLTVLEYMFGGRVGKPYPFMVGDTRFNNELFESSLLAIDDEADKTDIRSRRHLVAALKKIIAGRGHRCEGKSAKPLDIVAHWRVVMVSNLEPDNLRVLPPLDGDVIDKLILLKGHQREFSMPTGTVSEQEKFFSKMMGELPAFLWWLLNEYELGEEYRYDRFGVRSYLNPEIVSHMDSVTPWAELLLHLENEFFSGDHRYMVATCKEIVQRLRDRSSYLTMKEKDRYTAVSVGRLLSEVSRKRPERCWQTRASHGRDRLWVLLREGVNQSEVGAELRESIEGYVSDGQIELSEQAY